MALYIGSFVIPMLSYIASRYSASRGQSNLPAPQQIPEAETALIGRDVEVLHDAPQTVSIEAVSHLPLEITCTSEEFKQLLAQNYQFPPKVIVTGPLFFTDSSITTLPTGLVVRGNLHLTRCTSLTSLPEGLQIGGHLYFTECTSLTSLSTDLLVLGALSITNCTSLTSLSEGLQIGDGLYFIECTSLTSLPSWITTLGRTHNGCTRFVCLENTGLSDAIIERLRQTPAPGMQFYFSHRAAAPTVEFSNVVTALCFWFKEAKNEALPIPDITIDREFDHANVVDFLARLTETAEYKNLQTRPFLAARVIEAFHQMGQDEGLKSRGLDLINQGLNSCDDRIIAALEEIELMLLIHKIENGNHTAEELKKLGKSFLLLEMVNAKAKAHKETLTWVDEIEVYLAFQTGLADRFDLPVKTRNMFFRGCAQVSNEQLAAFGDAIEQECTDAKLETFLNSWSPWIKFQRGLVPSYEELAVADRELASDEICVFSQDVPEKPVLYNGNVYEYELFIQQYRTNGTDPIDRSKIDINQLKRLTSNK